MPTIQIRNVPERVYLTYKQRAMHSRKSLQEYLLGKLIEDAGRPTLDEVLDRAAANAVESITTDDIIDQLGQARSAR